MSSTSDYDTVARALHYLDNHFIQQPSLDELATQMGLSKFHLQRLFTRWAGVSPKRFLQFLTVEHAKGLLRRSRPVLATAFSSGLSGSARLHDLFVNTEGVTPGEYKTLGSSLVISYGFHPTPFGPALFAHTERGLCHLAFVNSGEGQGMGTVEGSPRILDIFQGGDSEADVAGREGALAVLRADWPGALIQEAPSKTESLAKTIFSSEPGEAPVGALSLFLKGTNFQIKVWEALLRIPAGAVTTYGGLADAMGSPNSARAVGSALAKNSLAYVIPCHRIIRKLGVFGHYRWGSIRKKAILGWETAMQTS